jgi:hypothetical protein
MVGCSNLQIIRDEQFFCIPMSTVSLPCSLVRREISLNVNTLREIAIKSMPEAHKIIYHGKMLDIQLHVFIEKLGNHSRVVIDTTLCFIVPRLANTQAVAWSTPSDPGVMHYVRLRVTEHHAPSSALHRA